MKSRNGRVFYSGRKAFSSHSPLYVLGINPGGCPNDHPDETVRSHTKWVIDCAHENWSAYKDESWEGEKPGKGGIQPSLQHLFKAVGIDPGEVPASNIVFARSATMDKYPGDFDSDAKECWAFHKKIIKEMGIKVVVAVGKTYVGDYACQQLKANSVVKRWKDGNSQPWESVWYRNSDGLNVIVLAHPSRGHQWTRQLSDPTWLVVEALTS